MLEFILIGNLNCFSANRAYISRTMLCKYRLHRNQCKNEYRCNQDAQQSFPVSYIKNLLRAAPKKVIVLCPFEAIKCPGDSDCFHSERTTDSGHLQAFQPFLQPAHKKSRKRSRSARTGRPPVSSFAAAWPAQAKHRRFPSSLIRVFHPGQAGINAPVRACLCRGHASSIMARHP